MLQLRPRSAEFEELIVLPHRAGFRFARKDEVFEVALAKRDRAPEPVGVALPELPELKDKR